MEMTVKYKIREDNKSFYIFDEDKNLLAIYSKEEIKTIAEVEEILKTKTDSIVKNIFGITKGEYCGVHS